MSEMCWRSDWFCGDSFNWGTEGGGLVVLVDGREADLAMMGG